MMPELSLDGLSDSDVDLLRMMVTRLRRTARRQAAPVYSRVVHARKPDILRDVPSEPKPETPPTLPKWCDQCARLVSSTRAAECESRFCKVRP